MDTLDPIKVGEGIGCAIVDAFFPCRNRTGYGFLDTLDRFAEKHGAAMGKAIGPFVKAAKSNTHPLVGKRVSYDVRPGIGAIGVVEAVNEHLVAVVRHDDGTARAVSSHNVTVLS